MTETNKTKIERLYEAVWNDDNPDAADELVHDEYLIHDRELAEEMRGPELYRALATGTREAFPDATFTIQDTVADEEKVAVSWRMTGTHNESLYGVDPTGRQVELTGIEINRFEDGALIETWTQTDQMSLMEQIGALPGND